MFTGHSPQVRQGAEVFTRIDSFNPPEPVNNAPELSPAHWGETEAARPHRCQSDAPSGPPRVSRPDAPVARCQHCAPSRVTHTLGTH